MFQTDTNIAPYFNDWDESKQFYQILFKAGQTVQARELTQIQDILNSQIESFGNHVFKNGSAVVGGNFTVQTKLKSVNFTITTGSVPSVIDKNSPITLKGQTTGVWATLTKRTDNGCFYEITRSGLDGKVKNFIVGEVIVFEQDSSEIARANISDVGLGSYARVEDGVYYIRGRFIAVNEQEIVLDELTNISTQIGLNVLEEIITSDEDESLFSNAQGYPNYRASGADRLKVTVSLKTLPVDSTDIDFVRLALVETGSISDISSRIEYSELEKILAQRTYEESGDYSVVPVRVDIREHLNDGKNNGVYTEAEGGDETKLVAVVEPGVHYVRGYRIENDVERLVEFPKSRETKISNNSVTPAQYGSLVSVKNCSGVPILTSGAVYQLLDSLNSEVGTMRVFSCLKTGTNSYHLVAREIKFSTGGWNNVSTIKCTSGSSVFVSTPEVNGILEGSTNTLIFNLPYDGIKTLAPTGSNDTNYTVSGSFVVTLDGSGVGTVSAPFGSQFTGSFNSFSVSRDDGIEGELSVSYTLEGSPIGSGIRIDCGGSYAGARVRALLTFTKNVSAPRSKVLSSTTDNLLSEAGTRKYALTKVDGVEIISITIDDVDYTNFFKFNNGQTDYSYELCSIEAKGSVPSGNMVVTYTHFIHGAGDYFNVDSYAGIEYNEIKGYTDSNNVIYDLRNCLDFRRTIEGASVDSGSVATPQTNIQCDIEYYLPRFVAIYVDSQGKFDSSVGNSGFSVTKPNVPNDSMRLVDFFVPSWTPSPESVVKFSVDNKRFTMREIGQFQKRLENLEYTTSLSLLEASASNIQVIDGLTGGNRFKTGIFADPFVDFRLVDVELSDVSIDDTNGGRLRPRVHSIGLNMERTSGGALKNHMISASLLTEVSIMSQPFATQTINVNPHAVFSWAGFVDLTPNRDFWVDTVYTEPKIINQTVNHRGSEKEGTVYGKWSRSSSGAFQFGITQERTNFQTIFTEWSTDASLGEDIIKTELVPYMRAIDIEFNATGLRPLTRVYPWFSNRLISDICTPDGGSKGDALITDFRGNISGTISIENGSGFTTGEKSFILTDNENEPNDPSARTTFGNSTFAASGTLITKQKKTLRTRHLGVTQRNVIEYRQYDPIAQSFTIETLGGVFCNGVDIFMASKSETIPLTVEIREMENGIPTHDVIARTVLNPENVLVSVDAQTATKVQFEPSVYLKNGGEYCIVLLANTQEYTTFISEMGRQSIDSTGLVLKQPHTGVFFTSSNGSTWTPMQNQDLKFKLYRENYDTSGSYVYLSPKHTDVVSILPVDPFSIVSGSNVLTVHYPSHGCKVGDRFTISGSLAEAGVDSSSINKTHIVSTVVDFDHITVLLDEASSETSVFGGLEVEATGGTLINLVNVNVDYTEFDTAKPIFEFRYRLQSTRLMSQWIQFTPRKDFLVPEEGSYRETGDVEVRAWVPSDGILSPQIDEFGFTVMLNSFRIDEELELFNYVTKPISLENPSTSGKFFISSLLPSGSSMKLYIRTEGDTTWTEISPENTILTSSSNFLENVFDMGDKDPFASFRLKVSLKGSRVNPPVLKDIRGIVLA